MLAKLTALRDALAADGVLRHLVAFVHPDTIIAFADGVAEAVAEAVEEQAKEARDDRREEADAYEAAYADAKSKANKEEERKKLAAQHGGWGEYIEEGYDMTDEEAKR